jgi:hypothetical protein
MSGASFDVAVAVTAPADGFQHVVPAIDFADIALPPAIVQVRERPRAQLC